MIQNVMILEFNLKKKKKIPQEENGDITNKHSSWSSFAFKSDRRMQDERMRGGAGDGIGQRERRRWDVSKFLGLSTLGWTH